MDGNLQNFTPLLSQQAEDEQRVSQDEQHREQQRGSISDQHTVISSANQSVNGSNKSKLYGSQSRKNLSSSFGLNSKPKRPMQQQKFHHLHHPPHPLNVLGDNTKNNVGHKASQTKRIQMSTAAKRCKSMNRSKAVDNNNSKAINLNDICKADDVTDGQEEKYDDVNYDAAVKMPSQCLNLDTGTLNSISNRSTESPTLVKIKTWYIEASVITLPSLQDVIF